SWSKLASVTSMIPLPAILPLRLPPLRLLKLWLISGATLVFIVALILDACQPARSQGCGCTGTGPTQDLRPGKGGRFEGQKSGAAETEAKLKGVQNFSVQDASAALPQNCQTTIRILGRSEEHTSELQSLAYLVCRLLLEKKNTRQIDDG